MAGSRRKSPHPVKKKAPSRYATEPETGHIDQSHAIRTVLDQLRPDPEIEALWKDTTPIEDDCALEESIKRLGCLNPINAAENGDIIDGRRRWRILKKLGKTECLVIVLKIKAEDKLELAVELNANRRHLTLGQKKQIVRKLLKWKPSYSARELGRIVAISHNTAEAIKKEMLAAKEIEKVVVVDRRGYRHVGGVVTSLGNLPETVRGMDKIKSIEGIHTAVPEPQQRTKGTATPTPATPSLPPGAEQHEPLTSSPLPETPDAGAIPRTADRDGSPRSLTTLLQTLQDIASHMESLANRTARPTRSERNTFGENMATVINTLQKVVQSCIKLRTTLQRKKNDRPKEDLEKLRQKMQEGSQP